MELNDKWYNRICNAANSGIYRTFILTGNVADFQMRANIREAMWRKDLFDLLKMDFCSGYYYGCKIECAITYNPRIGITVVPTKPCMDIDNKKPLVPEEFIKNRESQEGGQYKDLYTICNLMKRGGKRAFFLTYPQTYIPNMPCSQMDETAKNNFVLLHEALSSDEFRRSGNLCFIVVDSVRDINPAFVSSNINTLVLDIGLPDIADRKAFVSVLAKTYKDRGTKITNPDMINVLDDVPRYTAGLSLTNIADVFREAAARGEFTKKIVLDKKKELMTKENSDIIEIYDTDGFSLDKFAGQENIKSYFKDVMIDAIATDNISIIPKGVLLMGPPGTGKTYFSRCLAGSAGINFVEFKMSKILDKWVGESEKRLEKAFSVFRALAPVGVFIDEMDQALGRGNGDEGNSVSKNIFGMFLAELSKPENRGKIIWLGATNYPNKIDEALKRSGRFDKKIPFFAPSEEERVAVFKIHLKKCPVADDVNYEELAKNTNGYTQAEIENIVVKAMELRSRRKEELVTMKALDDALHFMLTAQNGRITEMEDIALRECNDLEFVPEKYRERQRKLLADTKEN